jgi:hypothetical protein
MTSGLKHKLTKEDNVAGEGNHTSRLYDSEAVLKDSTANTSVPIFGVMYCNTQD